MNLWRDGTHLSLDELDDVLSGEADADGELLRYLVPEAAARSPASCGRARLHGRSPQRPACFAASPKRCQSDAFSALFAGMSPAKRFSPARGPFSPLRASFSFSPARGASGTAAASPTARTRQLKSTVGVFAAGSEACFRGGQRAPEFPLIRCRARGRVPSLRTRAAPGTPLHSLPTPLPGSLRALCRQPACLLLQPAPGAEPAPAHVPPPRALPNPPDPAPDPAQPLDQLHAHVARDRALAHVAPARLLLRGGRPGLPPAHAGLVAAANAARAPVSR